MYKVKQISLILFLSHFLFIGEIAAQFPNYVKKVNLVANKTVTTSGNLNTGRVLSDLSWAWNSSIACFPGTQKKKFTGNHVFYTCELPPHSILHIKLVPKNKSKNLSLYAYSIGKGKTRLVPDLGSCVSCEADYKWDYKRKGKTQDHTRSVRLNAINNPYTVVIGVAGTEGLKSSDFDLQIKLETTIVEKKEQKAVKMYAAKSAPNKSVAYKGDLADGAVINDLSWAWNSAVACFPATQKKKFTGNHILYITEIPKYTIMTIELIPENKSDNMSLYAYEIGVNSQSYVPNLHSCVSCEVSHKWDYKHKGKTQDHTRKVKLNAINHPYKVVIGVAGANGLKKGKFIVKITNKSR